MQSAPQSVPAPQEEPGGSHCSPASMVPLPQSAGNVVLVEVVVVELVLVVVDVVVLVVVLDVVVVVEVEEVVVLLEVDDVVVELVLDVVVVFPGCVFLGCVVVVVGDPVVVVVVGRAAEAGWAARRSVHAKTL